MKSTGIRLKKNNWFDYLNILFMILFACSILYPFLNLLSLSFNEASGSSMHGLSLIPQKFSLAAYKRVLSSESIWIGYYNTICRTVLGTLLTLLFTSAAGYAISKKYFPDKLFWTFFIVFTMFFSGGLIPTYLLVKSLNLLDSRWSLILPELIPTFSLIIMRNYFMSLPDSLEESARIDGANDLTIFARIILPISTPILATVALWTAVDNWNAWFDCLIYIVNDKSKVVLQVILRRIILEGTAQEVEMNISKQDPTLGNPEVVKAATIFVTILPIIMLYPFVQKYFVKGIMMGSLKG